jgi:murein DD-endopeptidase MepM/ murein hydrolase activator NlpD
MAQYEREGRINDYNGDGQRSPGELAASSQRPADQPGYARKVEASMDEARELIAMAEKSGDQAIPSADVREVDGYAFPVAGYNKDSVPTHWGVAGANGGTDIFAERGTPVLAIGAGTITSAGYSDIGGYNVSIKLDNGLVAYYAHMDQPPSVQQGQRVEAGQQVGVVGDSGNAKGTGTHLHFGMGTDIINGAGASGGTGRNFDAVGVLNNILRNS